MSNEDDSEMRQASKDNDRFEGNTVNSDAALHSAEANRRMSTGDGRSGTPGDDDVTLSGFGPVAGSTDDDRVSKDDDLPDDAANDVDGLADQLADGVDPKAAERYARIILRRGDVLTASKADAPDPADLAGEDVDQIAEDLVDLDDMDTAIAIAQVITNARDAIADIREEVQEDDVARMNSRMGRAD